MGFVGIFKLMLGTIWVQKFNRHLLKIISGDTIGQNSIKKTGAYTEKQLKPFYSK